MPLPQAALERQQDAIFRVHGVDATWGGVSGTVRVIPREADEEMRLDRGTLIELGGSIRVRKSEVPTPSIGDDVQLLDADGNPVGDGVFTVTGEPQLDRRAVWHCPVGPIA